MKKNKYSIIVLSLCLLILGGLVFYANTGIEKGQEKPSSYTAYEKAVVEQILRSDISKQELFENSDVGSQDVLVSITSGDFKGLLMSATNYVGAMYGTVLKENDRVVVSMYIENGEIGDLIIYEYNRSLWILAILVLFAFITIVIGGRKGAQSLIGLVLTVISLIWILLPLLMKGFPTIPTVLFICILVAVTSFILIDGVSKKTVCAMIGTSCGLILAVLFGLIAQVMVKVNGMRMGDYVDALLQLRQGGIPISIKDLLIGGLLISCLGAVMDVAMSISSAIQELTLANPNLSRKDIWKSGMNIGRDMIGTMTNTLILAFVGSSFILILYIYSLNLPMYELLSSTLVATEVVHSVSSSIGVILSVPLTICISSFVFCKQAK